MTTQKKDVITRRRLKRRSNPLINRYLHPAFIVPPPSLVVDWDIINNEAPPRAGRAVLLNNPQS